MKKNIMLILIGLIVFTIIYAIYFPNSREPISINIDVLWKNPNICENVLSICPPFFATDRSLYRFDDFKIDDIGYPSEPDLPAGLDWVKPAILDLHTKNGNPVLQVPLGFYEFSNQWIFHRDITETRKEDDNKWKFEDQQLVIGDAEKKIEISNPEKGLITRIEGDRIFFKLDKQKLDSQIKNSEKKDIVFVDENESIKNTMIGQYSYQITDDGRIKRIIDGQVSAYLDRSFMGMNIAPLSITTNGEYLIILLQNLSSEIDNSTWVQIYNKDLKWNADIVSLRGKSRPVSICFFKKMIITAWDDGFVTGHSINGQEIFQKYIEDGILDMATDESSLYILTSKTLLKSILFVKDTQMNIYPRFAHLGQISSKINFDLEIESEDDPLVTLKNPQIRIISKNKQNKSHKVTFELDPLGLEKFHEYEMEIIIESGKSKEIVIVYFQYLGAYHEITLFRDFALDTKTSIEYDYSILKNNIDLVLKDKTSQEEIVINKLTSQAFILKR